MQKMLHAAEQGIMASER